MDSTIKQFICHYLHLASKRDEITPHQTWQILKMQEFVQALPEGLERIIEEQKQQITHLETRLKECEAALRGGVR